VPAADLLRQLPGVVDVEVLVSAPRAGPRHRPPTRLAPRPLRPLRP
jgi:hypothetical protein